MFAGRLPGRLSGAASAAQDEPHATAGPRTGFHHVRCKGSNGWPDRVGGNTAIDRLRTSLIDFCHGDL